ncbi:MAG: TonB family protein [Gammaproteobacteria bacterium]
MRIVKKDRASRSVFAAAVIAAHLLLVYFLSTALRDTTPISSAGEALLLLLPGESRETTAQSEPPEIEPQLDQPEVVWVPTSPNFEIREPAEASPEQAASRLGSGRPDVPGTLAPDAGIAVLQRVLPQYPSESMRAGEEGSTVLQVLVDESGRASEVRVARSSGYDRLDASAVKAVSAWKFAPSTKGALAVATWGEMEMRFELSRYTISRIVDAPLDLVPPGQILNTANDEPVPGGETALRGLMSQVRSADADAFNAPWLRDELKRMKEVLAGWGEAGAIEFRGTAAGNRWRAYEIQPAFRKGNGRETVELRWDVYRVSHDRGVSEWRIAIDRNGTIWCAHASAVRHAARFLQASL